MEGYKQKSITCPQCGEPMNPGGVCTHCKYDDPAEGNEYDNE